MKYDFTTLQDGTILQTTSHNNRAPGLLRVFIVDKRENPPKKMLDIKKDPTFRGIIAAYLGKPETNLTFRYNKNLGTGRDGILIQDATQKFQNAAVPDVEITVTTGQIPLPEPAAPTAPEVSAPVVN